MLENKGFTLIEALFSLSIFCVVYIGILSLLYEGYYHSEKMNQLHQIEAYEQVLDDEFYPINDISFVLEDLLAI